MSNTLNKLIITPFLLITFAGCGWMSVQISDPSKENSSSIATPPNDSSPPANDPIIAQITSVTSSKPNGAYTTSATIDIQIMFSKTVFVNGGTPTLDINSGTSVKANYLIGSGTNTLTFRYIVGAGDTSNNLNYISTSSLNLNGSTIKDVINVDALITLPSEVGSASLAGQKSLVIDTTPPTDPGAILAGDPPTNPLQGTPVFTFADSTDIGGSGFAANKYMIEIRKTSDNSIVKNYVYGSGDGFSGLNYDDGSHFLTIAESYYANIKAVDLAGNESSSKQTSSWTSCPPNFIPIPALSPYTSTPFCVAKFEMKLKYNGSIVADGNSLGTLDYDTDYENPTERAKYMAVSSPTGKPWTKIKRGENGSTSGQGAIEACQNMGTGYSLISNSQWQSIARNAELQNSNWTSGIVGTEMMYRGNSDGSSGKLSVNLITDPYDQTGDTSNEALGSGKEQRRTLDLSNGEVIWDLSGNANEWIIDNNSTVFDFDREIYLISDATHPTIGTIGNLTGTAKYLFGPTGDYLSTPLNTAQNGGLGYGFVGWNYGAILRGGDHSFTTYVGVFYVDLAKLATASHANYGFRCTYSP